MNLEYRGFAVHVCLHRMQCALTHGSFISSIEPADPLFTGILL